MILKKMDLRAHMPTAGGNIIQLLTIESLNMM